MSHLVILLQSGNHDDDAAPLLPHHVPEISHSVQHRPLGGDVGMWSSFVTLRYREEVNQSISQSINAIIQDSHCGMCSASCHRTSQNSERCCTQVT